MLWEDIDPYVALKNRFGFESPEQAYGWVQATVSTWWGLDIHSCDQILISDQNALGWLETRSESLIAKCLVAADKFEQLDDQAQVVTWLADQGIPVSAPVAARNRQVQLKLDGVSFALQRKIDGAVVDVTDLCHVQAAGAALGRLHCTLKEYPGYAARHQSLQSSLPKMVEGWLRGDRSYVPAHARQALAQSLSSDVDGALPIQLLHGDYRCTNILLSGSKISAVLDFDEMRTGHRVDELARSAVLLGTRYRSWEPVSHRVRSEFLDGYKSVINLSPSEVRWWHILVLFYSAAMIPKQGEGSSWNKALLEELSSPAWSSE